MIGIDLFAGAGGMSLGASNAGIDVQVVVELDKHAAQTYLLNHKPKAGFYNGDIKHFDKIELVNAKNEPTVLFGGPPCQGFSTSNQKTRNVNNSNNWLFEEFLRVIRLYNPEWVVFENVKGILETEQGKFAKAVIASLQLLGYKCEEDILNASDYGVPQKRDRYFIVASRVVQNFSFPSKTTNSPVTVADAIQDLPKLDNGANVCTRLYKSAPVSSFSKLMRKGVSGNLCTNNLVTRNSPLIVERYSHIPQGGNWENIPEDLMCNYKDKSRCHTGIYKRLRSDMPSVVIGNYRKNMLIHPIENRGLSVREAARIQSFPDTFRFTGSIGFQQQQVGNAVPPLLSESIFKQIMSNNG
ncbi:TPA: DNA cytosine methyltransferase [Vibrio cholerae]|uniref:DNA cytosine methyltransferase n=1 Tax=Vibrio cholerae TaxID=666 RepID=UPI000E0C5597|nr:DNA cytosine methyltransferase [Vibrio cholerae]ELH0878481.1 DNA cytosine methyltransferase [Vibrio cholerae]HBC2129149.1 DNA cytosine methyltransferase [Vibrio cholerae]HBC3994786.1 DNA cytosine methyltransferase [Vibrio cholerae]HDL9477733.1 DNA cytosine methyltransferase [Vibrio cholerae]HDZ3722809.1 DNA cytosine methyltransferase [Vibrio cholerae]